MLYRTPGFWDQDHPALVGVSSEELPDAVWKEITEVFLEEQVLS